MRVLRRGRRNQHARRVRSPSRPRLLPQRFPLPTRSAPAGQAVKQPTKKVGNLRARQFVGQDVLRRLSRRLGEGAFNGALTARVGVAGITLVRPLPFIEAKPPRVRDILGEVLRRSGDPAQASPDTAKS